jgi:SAM-dependent methyltransferase
VNEVDEEAPRLDEALRGRFDAWLSDTIARHSPPLAFSEIRKGVQALSLLYVERRPEASGAISRRSLDGAGKRAAFATTFGALHFLTAHGVARHLARAHGERFEERRGLLDLGCGTGAAGAGVATALGPPVAARLWGVDRSGWAVAEARRTARAFGLRASLRRGDLQQALRRARGRELVVLGWVVNELDEEERAALAESLGRHLGRGGGLLQLEPVARGVCPWWAEWSESLARQGAASGELKWAARRPDWIARMDRASGLDHRVLSARWLLV